MKYTLDVNQRGHIINLKAESSDNDTVFFFKHFACNELRLLYVFHIVTKYESGYVIILKTRK